MRILAAIVALLLMSEIARADTRQGYDVLALAKYCDTYLRAPKLPAVSTLLNTFGDPLPCIEKRVKLGGLEVAQIDLIDATCWRNRSCAPGVPRPSDTKAIKARAQKVQALASKYPQVEWWVSPALEHDEKNPATVTKMLQAAQAGCPSCKVINSPFSGATPPGYPVERHGTKVRAFAVSGDGASSFDADTRDNDGNNFNHAKSGADQTYLWFNELNLRCTGEEKAPPPDKRTARPNADQFRQAYQLTQPEAQKPPVPPVCRTVREIAGGELYKPNAEAYCNGQAGEGDIRGNRPLLIIKKQGRKGDRISAVSSDGKKVGCFQYYGPYSTPGLHRWYMGNCSGQRPYELMKSFGNEWGFVHLGGGSCLSINSVRRVGSYR